MSSDDAEKEIRRLEAEIAEHRQRFNQNAQQLRGLRSKKGDSSRCPGGGDDELLRLCKQSLGSELAEVTKSMSSKTSSNKEDRSDTKQQHLAEEYTAEGSVSREVLSRRVEALIVIWTLVLVVLVLIVLYVFRSLRRYAKAKRGLNMRQREAVEATRSPGLHSARSRAKQFRVLGVLGGASCVALVPMLSFAIDLQLADAHDHWFHRVLSSLAGTASVDALIALAPLVLGSGFARAGLQIIFRAMALSKAEREFEDMLRVHEACLSFDWPAANTFADYLREAKRDPSLTVDYFVEARLRAQQLSRKHINRLSIKDQMLLFPRVRDASSSSADARAALLEAKHSPAHGTHAIEGGREADGDNESPNADSEGVEHSDEERPDPPEGEFDPRGEEVGI